MRERAARAPRPGRRIALHEHDAARPSSTRWLRAWRERRPPPPARRRRGRRRRRAPPRAARQPRQPSSLPADVARVMPRAPARAFSSTASAVIASHAHAADRTVAQEARRARRRAARRRAAPQPNGAERSRAGRAPERHHRRARPPRRDGARPSRGRRRARSARAPRSAGGATCARSGRARAPRVARATAAPKAASAAVPRSTALAAVALAERVQHRRRPVREPAPRRTRRADARRDHRPPQPGEQRLRLAPPPSAVGASPNATGAGGRSSRSPKARNCSSFERSTPCGGRRRVASSQLPSRASRAREAEAQRRAARRVRAARS